MNGIPLESEQHLMSQDPLLWKQNLCSFEQNSSLFFVTIISFISTLTHFSKALCGCFPANSSIIVFFESFTAFDPSLTGSNNWSLIGKVLFQVFTLFFSFSIFSNKAVTFFSFSSVSLDSSGTFYWAGLLCCLIMIPCLNQYKGLLNQHQLGWFGFLCFHKYNSVVSAYLLYPHRYLH